MNIWNIAAEEAAIIAELEENGGELTEELEERLQLNADATEDKLTSYRGVIAQKEADNEAIDAEIKRLQALKKSNTNLIARLKGSILQWFNLTDRKDFKTATFKMAMRATKAVEVTVEAEELPEAYRRVKTTVEADKVAIKAAIEAGETIDGATIKTNYSLTIK